MCIAFCLYYALFHIVAFVRTFVVICMLFMCTLLYNRHLLSLSFARTLTVLPIWFHTHTHTCSRSPWLWSCIGEWEWETYILLSTHSLSLWFALLKSFRSCILSTERKRNGFENECWNVLTNTHMPHRCITLNFSYSRYHTVVPHIESIACA